MNTAMSKSENGVMQNLIFLAQKRPGKSSFFHLIKRVQDTVLEQQCVTESQMCGRTRLGITFIKRE